MGVIIQFCSMECMAIESDRVDANGGRELKHEGHGGRLGNNGEWANLLLGQLLSHAVGANVICS